MGAIVDEPRFHPHLTGRDNLRLLAAARGGGARSRIDPSLERVGLTQRAGDRVASYSMGMRQRLGVAACLLGDPELLILDEPMNGLDPAGIHEMRTMITSLAAEGRTVVLSSHLLDEVERTCDAVAIVDRGRIVRQGPIDELIRGAGGMVVAVDCAEPARAAALIDAAGLAAGPVVAEHGLAEPGPAGGALTVTLPAGASRELDRRPQPAAGRRRHRCLRPPRGPGLAGGLVPVRDEPPGRTVMTAIGTWLPTWDLITTKNLEIRRRRGLIITVAVLIVAPTAILYGLRLLFHAVDPHSFGLAGSPGLFSQTTDLAAEFGFIAAAALGAAAGTTDLSDGMFRHLVITGRSRLALYLARVPAGLAIIIPLVAVTFVINCLVTSYASPRRRLGQLGGLTPGAPRRGRPADLAPGPPAAGRHQRAAPALGSRPTATPARIRAAIDADRADLYASYVSAESPARTRRTTRWSRSGCGSSSMSGSRSWSASASARSPGSGRPRPSC